MTYVNLLCPSVSPDLKIVCEDGELFCHKIALASFSSLVKTLLLSSDSNIVIVPHVKKAPFEDLVELFYGDKLERANEEDMKAVFTLLSVDSKKILIDNVMFDVNKQKPKKSSRGQKLIKFKETKKTKLKLELKGVDTLLFTF